MLLIAIPECTVQNMATILRSIRGFADDMAGLCRLFNENIVILQVQLLQFIHKQLS